MILSQLVSVVLALQLMPSPQDGDIRTVFWELQNRSEVFLTLELKGPAGKPAPLVTFTVAFEGKQPKSKPAKIDLRAYPGPLWWPRAEWWFVLDERERVDIQPGFGGIVNDGIGADYVFATIPLDTLQEIARAERVTGNVLGFEVELTERQISAVRAFRDRVLSM